MFDDAKYYPTNAPELRLIGPPSTLAHWRCEDKGPAFHKWGSRVFYLGADLNAWLARQRIPTADQPAVAQPA